MLIASRNGNQLNHWAKENFSVPRCSPQLQPPKKVSRDIPTMSNIDKDSGGRLIHDERSTQVYDLLCRTVSISVREHVSNLLDRSRYVIDNLSDRAAWAFAVCTLRLCLNKVRYMWTCGDTAIQRLCYDEFMVRNS